MKVERAKPKVEPNILIELTAEEAKMLMSIVGHNIESVAKEWQQRYIDFFRPQKQAPSIRLFQVFTSNLHSSFFWALKEDSPKFSG